jgi:hypothetical protein
MKKVPAKKAKKSKGEPSLFLGYPDHVIVTGRFSSTDDSIDDDFKMTPRVGDTARLFVDDPMRDEAGDDFVCKVLAVNTDQGGDFTNITLQLHNGWRIAISH